MARPKNEYSAHTALKSLLQRDGFTSERALATLLLDFHFKYAGVIHSSLYYRTSLEIEGVNYRAWITRLQSKGYLKATACVSGDPDSFIRYEPGPKLLRYINREKTHRDEMATLQDVHDLRSDTNARITALEREIKSLKEVDEEREAAIKVICAKLGIPYRRPGHQALLAFIPGGKR